jgi:serine/threonine-protein kinase RsbT
VILKGETIAVGASEDVVKVRRQVRALAIQEGLTLTDQTKIVTAASELARNTPYTERRQRHTGGG